MKNKNTAIELTLPFGKTTQGSSSVHMRIRVVHVRYFNESNGFAILIVRKDSSTKDITVKGCFDEPCEGSVYDIDGEWIEDKKYGLMSKSPVQQCPTKPMEYASSLVVEL